MAIVMHSDSRHISAMSFAWSSGLLLGTMIWKRVIAWWIHDANEWRRLAYEARDDTAHARSEWRRLANESRGDTAHAPSIALSKGRDASKP